MTRMKMKTLLIGAVLAAGIVMLAAAYDNTTAFLSSIHTCAQNTTTDVSSAATNIDTINRHTAALYLYCAGTNSSSSGTATFYFERSPDNGTTWHKLSGIAVTISGTSAQTTGTTHDLDLTDTRMLRLGSVANSDTTYPCKVQAYIQYKP
jgi:hypothetical protein